MHATDPRRLPLQSKTRLDLAGGHEAAPAFVWRGLVLAVGRERRADREGVPCFPRLPRVDVLVGQQDTHDHHLQGRVVYAA